MTAEQLEELLATNPITSKFIVDRDDMYSLARRVLAAEKLVEALRGIERNLSDSAFYALAAYREASK